MEYSVGQKLWCQLNRNSATGYEVVVTKIARKWVTYSRPGWNHAEDRFDGATGLIDGHRYSSPGRIWPSKEAYESTVALNLAYSKFKRDIEYGSAKEGVTLEDLQRVREILKVPEKG